MTTTLPTPHSSKLHALLENRNLPESDRLRVNERELYT